MNQKRRLLLLILILLALGEGAWLTWLPCSLLHLLLPLAVLLPHRGAALTLLVTGSLWEVLVGRGMVSVAGTLVLSVLLMRAILWNFLNLKSLFLPPLLVLVMELIRIGALSLFASLYHKPPPAFPWLHLGGETLAGALLLPGFLTLWRKAAPTPFFEG